MALDPITCLKKKLNEPASHKQQTGIYVFPFSSSSPPLLPNFHISPGFSPFIAETCAKWNFYFGVSFAQSSPQARALEGKNITVSTLRKFLTPPPALQDTPKSAESQDPGHGKVETRNLDKVCPICSGPWKFRFLSPLPLLHHIAKITSIIHILN